MKISKDELLFHIPAQLECCPFLKTAPRSRPAAKHTNPTTEPSKHLNLCTSKLKGNTTGEQVMPDGQTGYTCTIICCIQGKEEMQKNKNIGLDRNV